MSTAGRWIRRLGEARPGLPRLVAVPHAGAGAIPFRPWATALAGRAELWVITPPGREARLGEAPVRDWAAWLAGAAEGLDELAGTPYALWGHSLGAMGAHELARARRGPDGPSALIVSGCRPPGTHRWDDPDGMTDAALVERLRALGGTPAAVLASEEIMALVLPTLRADFKLASTYAASPGGPLALPVTALAGVDDRAAPHGEMDGWAAVTRGPFTRALFPGDHFFPFAGGAAPAVVDAVVAALR